MNSIKWIEYVIEPYMSPVPEKRDKIMCKNIFQKAKEMQFLELIGLLNFVDEYYHDNPGSEIMVRDLVQMYVDKNHKP
jgi:hypothetical protein